MAYKPKHTREEVCKIISNLESSGIPYEDLMERYGNTLKWARRMLKDPEIIAAIDGIKRKALLISIRRNARRNEDLSIAHTKSNYPYLLRCAESLYQRKDGKSPWQQVVEEAGFRYPSRRYEEWSLKRIIMKLRLFGDSLEERTSRDFQRFYTRLYLAVRYRIGSIGKALILVGIDYTRRKRVSKAKCYFTDEELSRIVQDNSLSKEDKAACIFNALALQYFPLEECKTYSRKELDSSDDSFRLIRQEEFLDRRVRIAFEQSRNPPLLRFGVLIELSQDIENRIHNVRWYFQGGTSADDSLGFYYILRHTLASIDNQSVF